MRKKYKLRADASENLDLFPFLSIMLCVVGVLAFVQVLLAMTSKPKVQLAGEVKEGYRVGYQIICGPQGAVLVPPADQLEPLVARMQGEDAAKLRAIREQRRRLLQRLRQGTDADRLEQTMDGQLVLSLLHEVKHINTLARTHAVTYEEFLLFGIRPGGGATYHRFRKALSDVEFKSTPETGLMPLDPEWQLAVPSVRAEATP